MKEKGDKNKTINNSQSTCQCQCECQCQCDTDTAYNSDISEMIVSMGPERGAVSGVVERERMGTAFPHKKSSGNGVPTREIFRDIF